MKTISQHFDDLPEMIRVNAVNNVIKQRGEDADGVFSFKVEDLFTALSMAFNHSTAPEGFNYWAAVLRDVESKEKLNVN